MVIMRRRLVRVLLVVLGLAVALGAAGALWARAQVRASLPLLDGTVQLEGLVAPVGVTRDSLGIPTIKGTSREDVARATGFLHAQDRFFQMDLARRRAAGELAALVGSRALPVDRESRLHRFREEARKAVSLLSSRDGAILNAYTAGVNGGLTALRVAPFEYLLLRQNPEPWRAEDSLLVVLSMFLTLQDDDGSYESTLSTMHDVLPQDMFDFLAPRGTEGDAPVVGGAFAVPPVPGPDVYDARTRRREKPRIDLNPRREEARQRPTSNSQLPNLLEAFLGVGDRNPLWELGVDREAALGSNNWAIAGRLTPDGGALVANDMHLTVRVPNTWYRAALEWPDPATPTQPHVVTGVTLPGVPAVIVGSNTYVAWGFTNTYADWADIVLLDVDPGNPNRYRTPDGWREFERHVETIAVAGGDAQQENVTWTIWGPVLQPDYRGRARALRWVAHSAERLASTIRPLEEARTLEEAFHAANGVGAPGQNVVMADRSGRIGWTIYGAIPRRVGIDGALPSSWSDGSRGWQGWLEPREYPRLLEPDSGRLWTANARVVDGEMLAKLGDGSYEIGARASRIRDRLAERDRFTAEDMLNIQLDTSATFLSRWRELILRTLSPPAVAASAGRRNFREIVDHGWTGDASANSAAYRLTRLFREQVSERVIAFVLAECYEADPTFDYRNVRKREGPIWKLVTEQPPHLLDPQYASWGDLIRASIDAVIQQTEDGGGSLSERTWSDDNVTAYRHPLSAGLPLVGRWLDMPARALPGDLYTLRMHWGAAAASERMVVSPGHEQNGIMHMPTGQSGNPLSPFYSNSHEAWVKGEATPFLPGATEHELTLTP